MRKEVYNMPTEYSDLVNLFVDLRGRGVSLSTIDLDILQSWQKNDLSAHFIAKVMIEIADDCKIKKKHFPNSLEAISKKINKILLKMREV